MAKHKPFKRTPYGFDGVPFVEGDRIEMHPGTDFWMRGARYGTVETVLLNTHTVQVRLDAIPHQLQLTDDRNVRKTSESSVQPLPPAIMPYTPDAERLLPDDSATAPLTPQERDLAERLFRLIRHAAVGINYTFDTIPLPSVSAVHIVFDEHQARNARVKVEFVANEFSTGYGETGVAGDLATALSLLSDDDDTNGSSLWKE